ncbi:MAG TPA: YCF48-related protein [Thermoanaerobaculia bacterium]
MRRLHRPRLLRALLPATILLAAISTRADAPWVPFGPGGGPVISLAVDPGNDTTVYAVTGTSIFSAGALYKSGDGGLTWQGLTGTGLRMVAVAPDRPATVYAGGPYSFRRSTDGGRTWSDVTLSNGRDGIDALAVAPGGVVFAGNLGLLLRSGNGGATWAAVAGDASNVVSILVDPSNPSRVYYASLNRVYKSVDGGLSWAPAGQPQIGNIISVMVLAPSTPDRLYLMGYADNRVFRSDDGAQTWRSVGEVPLEGKPALRVDPRSPDRVYVANQAGVFRSDDGGVSWQPASRGLPSLLDWPPMALALAVSPSRPGVLYAGTSDAGVARSLDAGGHWRVGQQPGLTATSTSLLKFHPRRPDTLYLGQGLAGDRSFRSTDGGRTWQGFARTVTREGWYDLALDPDDPDRLYAATSRAIWRSEDGGESWDRISDQHSLKLAALGRQVLLAADCGVSRSADGGRTWGQVIACNDPNGFPRSPLFLWADPEDRRTAYVLFSIDGGISSYFSSEVFRTRDGGATWTKLGGLRLPGLLAVAPGDSRILYVVDRGFPIARLLRSRDGGDHWTVVSRGFTANQNSSYASLVVDAADPDTLYVAASPLQISHDGGATFRALSTPFDLGKKAAGPLWTDRLHPGLLYAADILDGGLFVRRF